MRTPTRRSRDQTLVRFPRRRRRRMWLRLAVVLAVLGLALAAVAYLWTVREVRIVGTNRVSALEVHSTTRLLGGERMLMTDMDEVALRVERIPLIRSAEASRTLLATVEVRVVERVPLVRLEGRPELAADSEARVFELPDGPLPLLAGWESPKQLRPGGSLDRRSTALLSQLSAFPEPLLASLARIEVGEDIVLHVSEGPAIHVGGTSDLGAKAAAGWAVLTDARSRGIELQYIDARAPTAPVARPKEVRTPAPSRSSGTGSTPRP